MKNLSKIVVFLFAIALSFTFPDLSKAACSAPVNSVGQCPRGKIHCDLDDGSVQCCDQIPGGNSCSQVPGSVQATIPPTAPDVEAFPKIKFPCSDTDDPEFHSLRPYQGAPCGDAGKALFCSNELNFIEDFDVVGRKDCKIKPGQGTIDFTCSPDLLVREHNLYVELTDSMFPILGNTEQVRNSLDGVDEFDDATKVNEYASWYLSGVNDRAEYGVASDDQTVNFSGPVKKLLPSIIQDAERIRSIENVSEELDFIDEDTGKEETSKLNHDQIVGCAESKYWFGIGPVTPVPCNAGEEYRLSEWDKDDLGLSRTFERALSRFLAIAPGIGPQIVSDGLASIWDKRKPPLPWSDENGEPFKESIYYQKAYNEWRGKTCVIIPFIKKLICIDLDPTDVFVNGEWSEMYHFIPLSNTTDIKGAERILDVQFKPSNGTAIDSDGYDSENQKSAPLYFAHTKEVKELSDLLNTTYIPQGYESEKLPETTEKLKSDGDSGSGAACTAVNVRTNPGDNLFPGDREPGDTKEIIIPDVTYRITETLCHQTVVEKICTDPVTGKDKKCPEESIVCNAEVYLVVKTDIKVPNADEIFSSTVADSGSTFRKMFPKVGEGSPVTCIADIPAVSNVTYDGSESETPNNGSLEFKVSNFPKDGAGGGAQLTFPHIGSVYEYFLKGIQTALRPKGYGTPIENGVCTPTSTGTGSCKLWLFEKDKKGAYYYDKVIQAAAATSCNGKKLNPFWAVGIALNENGGLMSDDLEGLSKSHFGCNINQLQTIEDKISCMVNTLRNDCVAGKTDEQALQEYGYLPGYILFPVTVLDPGGSYPPPLFGSGFNVEQLKINLLNADWRATYASKAPIFCPSSPSLPY